MPYALLFNAYTYCLDMLNSGQDIQELVIYIVDMLCKMTTDTHMGCVQFFLGSYIYIRNTWCVCVPSVVITDQFDLEFICVYN